MTQETLEIVKARLEKLDAVPTLPAILRPLLDYVDQPTDEVELDKIVELVSCDEAITAQCLRLANSSLYSRLREVTSIRGAIMALGVRRLRDMLLSSSLVRLLPHDPDLIDPIAFWEHSFGCALVSRQFAQKIRYPEPERAYLAGLLHDLGELVNSMAVPDLFLAASERARAQHEPFYEAEQAVMGFTHCQSGAFLAERWKLPEELADTIGHHHDIEQAKRNVSLVAIVRLSDLLCGLHGLTADGYEPTPGEIAQDAAWAILEREYPGVAHMNVDQFTADMNAFVVEVRKLVDAIFRN